MPGRLNKTLTTTDAGADRDWLARLADDLAAWLTRHDASRCAAASSEPAGLLAAWWNERLATSSPLLHSGGTPLRRRWLRQLSDQLPRCRLWCGWPTDWDGDVESALGKQWYWLSGPAGSPSDWCSLLSCLPSRQERWEVAWQQRLWVALRQLSRSNMTCLTSEASPAQLPILAAAERLGVPTVRLQSPDSGPTNWHRWLRLRLLELVSGGCDASGSPSRGRRVRMHYFPAGDSPKSPLRESLTSQESGRLAGVPPVDRGLALLPGRIMVVAAKCGGRTYRSVEHRLTSRHYPDGSTRVLRVAEPACSSPSASERAWQKGAAELQARGAVVWLTPIDRWRGVQARLDRQLWYADRRTCQPLLLDQPQADDFLIHCTRSAAGPWPDQSQLSFDDHLLMSESGAGRSPLESLMRIVIQQRLIASQQLRRGDLPTVCLSAVRLEELLGRRKFQSHLGRWDWEPYGIAIRRQSVARLGGRPVDYRPESEAGRLSPQQLAFYQPDKPHWIAEREWRLIGDLRLDQIPSTMAFVFVPTLTEARQLQPISHWPIWVIPEGDGKLAKN